MGLPKDFQVPQLLDEGDVKIVRRTGNAWVIGANQHFEGQGHFLLGCVGCQQFRNQLVKVSLNIGMVLVRRNDAISGRA